MRLSRLAALLLALGVLAGVLGSIGLLVGFEPSRLPPALLDVAAYKLTFAAALLLLALGAILRRHARRATAAPPGPLPGAEAAPPLAAGAPLDAPTAGARRAAPPPVEREPRP